MGTKFAPTYATLVLGYLEEKLYATIAEKYDDQFRNYFEKNEEKILRRLFFHILRK